MIFIFILNYNNMNYNDLFFLAKEKGISIASLAKDIKMTSNGLKKSFESKKLPWEKIESICEIFGLTPNQLLGWPVESQNVSGNYASNISGGNTQNSNEAIKALKDQLKEKDRQISRLMTMLEKREHPGEYGTVIPYMAAEDKHSNKGRGKK